MRLLQLAKGGACGHAALRQDPRGQWAPGHAVHSSGGALVERAVDLEPSGRAAGHGSDDADTKSGAARARRAGEKRARARLARALYAFDAGRAPGPQAGAAAQVGPRSEEHTSELQSRGHLVCRLLLEKKKKLEYG